MYVVGSPVSTIQVTSCRFIISHLPLYLNWINPFFQWDVRVKGSIKPFTSSTFKLTVSDVQHNIRYIAVLNNRRKNDKHLRHLPLLYIFTFNSLLIYKVRHSSVDITVKTWITPAPWVAMPKVSSKTETILKKVL